MHPQGMVRQILGLALLVTLIGLALSACGGGEAKRRLRHAPCRRARKPCAPVNTARWSSSPHSPLGSARVGRSRSYNRSRTSVSSMSTEEVTTFVAISFNNPPPEVNDPRHPNKLVSAPKDWVYWFEEHPYLKTSSPQPTSVGGVEGRRLDTRVSSLPNDYYSEDCLGAGVPLWPLLGGHHWCADEGVTTRTILLESIEGETVIIDVWSSSGTFEKVLPEAKEVLDTVEWEGA